jgi:hypothetical protein
MAANLTETAIRGLKTKSTAYYVWSNSAQRGTGRLGVKVQPSGSKVFYFRYYVEKGKKEKFIQLGIWPEMKLVTANELAKKYGAWLVEGKEPSKSLSNSAWPSSTLCRSIVLRDRLKNWCMATLTR